MALIATAPAAERTPGALTPPAELRLDLAQPGVRIVHPAAGGYPAIARRLAAELGALTGTAPGVVAEDEANALTGPAPLLVLGNLMDSAVVRRLYCEAYDFTDYAFPGPGGCTLRTIRDPLRTGAHVLLVGGSDAAGVEVAAGQLASLVKQRGAALGYVNEVRLGRWTTAAQMDTARYLADDDAVWLRVGQSGSWDYMDSIAKCGTGYLRTGDERYLALFKRELNRFIADDVFNPNPEAMQMLHGRLYVLLTVWDLVRDHAMFAPADRERVDGMFLHVARSAEGTKQIAEVAATTAVRYNHHTRAGLDAFFVGRFFERRYGLAEARDWLATAEKLFAPQLASAKPACDSWGHQWAASLFNALVYALATGREDYVKSPAFKLAADRALIAYGRAAPRHYMSACAVASGDTGYLSLEPDLETLARDAAQLRLVPPGDKELVTFTDEVLRTFTGSAPIVRRADLLGLGVAPLDAFWHDTIETPTYNPGGIFAVTVPQAEAFDKAALRDGWGADDFYLLLDGISGGHHAYQDANCLVWLREGGVDWFTPQTGYAHSMGVRAQNGVNTALDGRGREKIHRYARLLYRGTRGEFSAVGAALDGVGAVNWERHILRRRGAWTLVVDRAVSSAGGELLFERFWYPKGELTVGTGGFTSRQEGVALHFVSLLETSGETSVVERARANVTPGGSLTGAGLLWSDGAAAAASCALTKTDHGWRVRDAAGRAVEMRLAPGGGVTVLPEDGSVVNLGAVAPVGPALRAGRGRPGGPSLPGKLLTLAPAVEKISLPWREVRLDGRKISAVAGNKSGFAVGTADGTVVAYDAELHERWRTRQASGILSLEFSGADVVVGEERGGLALFDAAGRARWTVEIPWVTLPWAYWGEERSRIREIAAADLDGDGVDEILVSNADRRVYAFDRAGRELWKRPIEWGVFTAMWPGAVGGKFALAGGTSRPSIHGWTVLLGADGAVSGHRQRPDLTCWSLPSCTLDLQWTDIDGDGAPEIVCALDTNCRQLVAYRPDGAVKWDLDVAGAATALAFDAAHRRVLCASAAGYVVAADGATGRRVWAAWIGEAANLLWVLPDGRIAACTARGRVWVLSAAGELLGAEELGGAVTAMPRPGNHRGPDRRLMLGTAQGRVLVGR
jgi:outer membrane protein assembly factor BamB